MQPWGPSRWPFLCALAVNLTAAEACVCRRWHERRAGRKRQDHESDHGTCIQIDTMGDQWPEMGPPASSTATLRKASSPAAAPSPKPQAVSTDNLRLGAPSTSSSSTCLPEAAAVRRSSLSDSPSPHLSILRSQLPPEPLINQRPVLAPENQS
jgi:hypothetical protein